MKHFVVAAAVTQDPAVHPAAAVVVNHHMETTDVVVVGNGPSALSLSYVLNGNWPYYNGSHPDEVLHARLEYEKDKSILEMDFAELSSGISGQSRNIISNLFDQLLHPTTVYGDMDLESCIDWRPIAHKVPHLILGPNPPGGAWQNMHGCKKALSFNHWLQLPGLPIAEWAIRKGFCLRRFGDIGRLPLALWKAYYADYPHQVGLEDNLRTGYVVHSVKNLFAKNDEETGENLVDECDNGEEFPWEIRGDRMGPDGELEPFLIRARKVVLATGTAENPKRLLVAGEDREWTGHTYDALHNFVADNLDCDDYEDIPKSRRCWCRVLIVGSGLTAADAVITALTAGCHVFHIFDPKHSILSQLSERLYPEYANVWKSMNGERNPSSTYCGHYTPFPNGQVIQIKNDHVVSVESEKGKKICLNSIGFVAILVGSSPKLEYLQQDIARQLPVKVGMPLDAKRNPVAIDQITYESIYQPGLYALGPLCGDNYVRYIPGGAVAAARSLIFADR